MEWKRSSTLLMLSALCAFVGFIDPVFATRSVLQPQIQISVNHREPTDLKKSISATETLWPMPESFASGSQPLSIDPETFLITSVGSNSEILTRAIQRYSALCFPHEDGKDLVKAFEDTRNALAELRVNVRSETQDLVLGVDESYTLSINGSVAYLTSNTVFGALHGLETFSQLIRFDYSSSTYSLPFSPYNIVDKPRFPHRGVLIDTSRHFLPVDYILTILDGLAAVKMNVFHWHVCDGASFPFEVRSYPGLSLGAWSKNEIYTHEQLKEIVQYATDRGIRIIPEFDIPGHTASWAAGYPEIVLCLNETREDGFCASNPCGQLDPTKELTYQVIEGLVAEMGAIFPDHHFHFGADEVVFKCWETPEIRKFMEENRMADFVDLFQYFQDRVWEISSRVKKTPVQWLEVFSDNLDVPENVVIQVWFEYTRLRSVLQAGYKSILSNYDAWYLDCGWGNWCPYRTWQDMYNNEPFRDPLITPSMQELLIGGEACLWFEQVDRTNALTKLFPRLSAVAERLWSPSQVNDVKEAKVRLLQHRCHLMRRGVDTEPLEPGSNVFLCNNIMI
eukprot:TRINITY_DN13186_c0_g1_i1.p1 TRINITY_DN13186_c0_g1~~TRINITY_DN13186_c0_g1_i1.p1  ORF type:complete len:564 (+),score=117.28 TRINITY_DN13186_c0_g1_i1:46-1737(+)